MSRRAKVPPPKEAPAPRARWKTPKGEILEQVRDGFELRLEGKLVRVFKDHDSSVSEWLYHTRYRVEGDALVEDFTGESDGGATMSKPTTELTGLVALDD